MDLHTRRITMPKTKQNQRAEFSKLVERVMPAGLEKQPLVRFRFKKRTLDPKLAKLITQMNTALKQRNVTNKAEQLVAVIEESQRNDRQIFTNGLFKSEFSWIGFSMLGGVLAGLASLVAAAAAPLGLIAVLPGAFYMLKPLFDTKRADRDLSLVGKTVSQKLIDLHKKNPQEVESAPRFQRNKTAIFNLHSVPPKEYSYAFSKPTGITGINRSIKKALSL